MDRIKTDSNEIFEIIEKLIEKEDWSVLKQILIDIHPADLAEIVMRLDRNERERVFENLGPERAAEVLVELDSPIRQDILKNINETRLVRIVGSMDSDDATDIIGELEEDTAKRVLESMPSKEHHEVETLLVHDEETAGGIMALEIVAVNEEKTAHQALEELRNKADEVEDVYNIYVIDSKRRLKGVASLKDVVLADPQTRLSEIMDRDAVFIHHDMDQEEVANIFHKYNLVAAPVVDKEGRLIGRITVDDVLDVVEEEASEDISLMAGITDEEIRGRSIFRASGVRLPWLLIAFGGEIVSAVVMSHFKTSLNQIVASAFFIPLIMAMGGNTGMQSATVVIRGLATGDINLRDTGRRLFKEIGAVFLNGIVISLLLFGVAVIWLQQPRFGLILAVAMMSVLFNATFMGTMIPFLLKRLGVDPAIATGPFITTSNDILGLVVYFGIMSIFFNWL